MHHLLAWRRSLPGDQDSKNVLLSCLLLAGVTTQATQLGLFSWLRGVGDASMLVVGMFTPISIELARRYLGLPPARAIAWLGVAVLCATVLATRHAFVTIRQVVAVAAMCTLFVGYLVGVAVRHWNDFGSLELRWILGGWGVVAFMTTFDLVALVGGGAPLRGIQLTTTAILAFALIEA